MVRLRPAELPMVLFLQIDIRRKHYVAKMITIRRVLDTVQNRPVSLIETVAHAIDWYRVVYVLA
jgi:hypothetical protein